MPKNNISEKNTPENLTFDKRTCYSGSFREVCRLKHFKIFCINKNCISERAIQITKHKTYSHLDDHGKNLLTTYIICV